MADLQQEATDRRDPGSVIAGFIDAMQQPGRRDLEAHALLRTATDGIVALGAVPEHRAPDVQPLGASTSFALLGISLIMVIVRLLVPGDAGSARDATSFLHAGVDIPSGRYLVMTVPVAGDDERASGRAMAVSQRHALEAAVRCVGRGSPASLGFRSSEVGGASAGLVLAVAAVDVLHRLDHDRRVAGTGTISATGEVGPVEAVAQKAAAAEAAGAELFLVPADQANLALEAVERVPVVGVRSLDEALRVLTGSGCPA